MSRADVAFFASVTFGWLNGSICKAAPTSAVNHSQKMKCSPSSPCTLRSDSTVLNEIVKAPPISAPSKSSAAIGSRPTPDFPVDSAISCSIQSDSPGIPECESINATYCSVCVVSSHATSMIAAPSARKLFLQSLAASSRSETSTPANALGTKPKALNALNLPPT